MRTGLATAVLGIATASLAVESWFGEVAVGDDGAAARETELVEGRKTLDELREVVHVLESERRSYYQRRRERTRRLDRARRSVVSLDAEVAALRAEDEGLEGELERRRRELGVLQARRDELALDGRRLRDQLAGAETRARSFVERGPPFRTSERLAKLEESIAPLDDGPSRDASDRLSLRLRRLWHFARDELDMARSSEVYSGELSLPVDLRIHARFVRVGHAFLGYVDERGDRAGIWCPSAGWNHEPSAPGVRAVRAALGILDGHELRRFVSLPVTARVLESVEEGPARSAEGKEQDRDSSR